MLIGGEAEEKTVGKIVSNMKHILNPFRTTQVMHTTLLIVLQLETEQQDFTNQCIRN